MGDRTQRLKGKVNESVGRAKANTGHASGHGKTEAKGVGQMVKGKTQKTVGKARKNVKKATRQP
jgi:uncharacterized protein YjbJ (UPF0337 family)